MGLWYMSGDRRQAQLAGGRPQWSGWLPRCQLCVEWDIFPSISYANSPSRQPLHPLEVKRWQQDDLSRATRHRRQGFQHDGQGEGNSAGHSGLRFHKNGAVAKRSSPMGSRSREGLDDKLYSLRAPASMRSSGPTAAFGLPLLGIVKATGSPLTDIAPWVMYLNSPDLGARSVAEK